MGGKSSVNATAVEPNERAGNMCEAKNAQRLEKINYNVRGKYISSRCADDKTLVARRHRVYRARA